MKTNTAPGPGGFSVLSFLEQIERGYSGNVEGAA